MPRPPAGGQGPYGRATSSVIFSFSRYKLKSHIYIKLKVEGKAVEGSFRCCMIYNKTMA